MSITTNECNESTRNTTTNNNVIENFSETLKRTSSKLTVKRNNDSKLVRSLIFCDRCSYEVVYHFTVRKNENFIYSNCVGPCPRCGSRTMSIVSEDVRISV